MAEAELLELHPRNAELTARLEDLLLVEPGEDFERLIVEIRAGTGGDEAALFAGDLYEMYTRFARARGWTVEEMNFSPGEAGGFKEVVFGIRGEGALPGIAVRVRRAPGSTHPQTETQGRIHTSAATVAIMPEPDEAQIDVNPNEIEIETMRAGGAGGQHVNKTESAVRLWYRRGTPDELEVKCQDERSQHKNRERAMRVLRSPYFRTQPTTRPSTAGRSPKESDRVR